MMLGADLADAVLQLEEEHPVLLQGLENRLLSPLTGAEGRAERWFLAMSSALEPPTPSFIARCSMASRSAMAWYRLSG